MKFIDIVKRSGKNIWQAKTRTILTALSIAVGALCVTVALAAGEGGRQFLEKRVSSMGDTTLVTITRTPSQEKLDKEKQARTEATRLQEYNANTDVSKNAGSSHAHSSLDDRWDKMNNEDIEKIKSVYGITKVMPDYQLWDLVKYVSAPQANGKHLVASVKENIDKTKIKYVAGKVEGPLQKGEAVLPEEYLVDFGFKNANDALGKELIVHSEKNGKKSDAKEKIVAVSANGENFGMPRVMISFDDVEETYKQLTPSDSDNGFTGIYAYIDNPDSVDSVQSRLKEKGFSMSSLKDTRQAMMEAVNIAQNALVTFGMIVLFASVFGIINTMYISVLERTKQIGLMKALGASRRDIGRMFRYEAGWVGFLGAAIGVAIAYLITLLNPLIAKSLKLDEGTNLLIIEPMTVLVVIASLIIMAITASYFPSRRAAKMDPIEALRTE